MAGNRRLKIEILGDARGLSRAFGQAESSAGRFARGVGTAMRGAALGLAGMGAAAIIAAPRVLEMGTALQVIDDKARTVFTGASLGAVQSWAESTAAAMGLTATQAVGLATNMADLLKPMGFTADQAATMSTDMLDLSGALSAWTGGTRSAAEVADILTKAMLGEREQLKELGISISAADVQARLAAKGQDKLTGAALAQAEAVATQELILEKSTDAQKAWEDGTMAGIQAQNEARASIENVKEGLVRALFPALQAAVPHVARLSQWLGEHMPGAIETVRRFMVDKLIPAFEDHVLPVMRAVADWVAEHWPEISGTITEVMRVVVDVVTAAVDVVMALWEQFGDDILGFVRAVWPAIERVIGGALDVIQGVFRAFAALFRGDWSALWAAVQQIVAGAWALITGAIQAALSAIAFVVGAGWGLVRTIVGSILDSVWSLVVTVWGNITGSVRNALAAIGTAVSVGLGTVRAIASGALSALQSAWNGTFGAMASAVQWVIDKVTWLIQKAQDAAGWIADLAGWIPGRSAATPGGVGTRPLAKPGRAGTFDPGLLAGVGVSAGGTVIHLTVHAGFGTDGASVGRQIVSALRDYQSAHGAIPVRVADRG